ncbi:glycyl-tRNA synthetase [Nematocida sp. LUAm3]|nr:glycyl-tRNA synthetase [Nematocida sp. LUAm3]KAI5175403.1 glycyl-tRNA synthetase [Nematocida sp. LUAm2]KAI5177640.1 glycyl-tRNA synthetase [Nematocida sp. LUAm1]
MSNEVETKRKRLEQTAKRRFFYTQSFESYGGVSGFFDYGPPMCALQNNFLSLWRKHFILEEFMLEVDCSIITPFDVLKTSGHVDKFTDLMCSDIKTGEIYRADHLVKEWLVRESINETEEKKEEMNKIADKIDSFNQEQLQEIIESYQIKSEHGNALGPVVHFNLMFTTVVGPGGKTQSYLRPETAQGQFLNFKRLLEANGDKMPFASAMVGKSFRNEISPRTGLFRVREFLMAEIEHYVHPDEKEHPKFANHKDLMLPLLFKRKGEADQTIHQMTIGDAVINKIVNNETLGYFMARVFLFLVKIGIPESQIRFRQHLETEMAHYATDCWDAEINTSYGWIECIGIADRACYDLSVHTEKTGEKLIARRTLKTPVTETKLEPVIDRKALGIKFRGKAPKLMEHLANLSQEEIESQASNGVLSIEYEGEKIEFPIEQKTVIKHVEEYIPNVIEPSFGIGRILYALLWHAFTWRKEDEQRVLFEFKPAMAPIKTALLPLMDDERFAPLIRQIRKTLVENNISCQVDESSASVGKRYSRADEVGIPFCITIDFETLEDLRVTVRERDSTKQIRIDIEMLPAFILGLSDERIMFRDFINE